MVFIDENGKLFGKINILDLLALIVIILLLVWGVSKLRPTEKEWKIYEVEVCANSDLNVLSCGAPLPDWFYRNIIEEDQMVNLKGIPIAAISKVSLVPYGGGKKVNLLVNMSVFKKGNSFIFEDTSNKNLMKINKKVSFVFSNISFVGNIIGFGDKEELSYFADKSVDLLLKDLRPEIYSMLKVGLSEYDSNSNSIATIIYKTETPSKMIVTSSDGEVFLRENPINKDILLKINLKVKNLSSIYYYNSQEIKIGNTLQLSTLTIDFSGQIVSFG